MVCQDLQDAGKRTTETKRKADDAHDRIRTYRFRCRRATKELETAEKDFNDSLALMSQLIKDTAGATHALSCGVPNRESNEVRYLQEALDMIEDFQRRGFSQGTTDITLVECQKIKFTGAVA